MAGYLLAAALATAVAVLLGKLWLLRRSAREIREALAEKLELDTNTLLDLPSRDRQMRALAAALNDELRQLYRLRQRYQQGDLELKEAVANLSHDLRTPLTTICGYLDLLEREPKSEAVTHDLAQIRRRTEELCELTEELFRYSLAASVHTWTPERVNLVQMLEESLLQCHEALGPTGVSPRAELPEQPVWRQLNPGAVRRIFGNLISNAVKYGGGDFSVRLTADGSVTFSNPAEDLDPVAVGKLFDRFYTVASNRHATGLGLSIAKLLTERMGGTICADHRDGVLSVTVRFAESESTPA